MPGGDVLQMMESMTLCCNILDAKLKRVLFVVFLRYQRQTIHRQPPEAQFW
jgi:hypothetical protein